MKYSEIKPGEIFTIEETPSYPKLRTTTGYVDMRDKIVVQEASMYPTENLRLMNDDEFHPASSREIEAWAREVATECKVSIS